MQNLNTQFLFVLGVILLFSLPVSHAQDAPIWLQHIVREEITDPAYLESRQVLDPYSIATVRITMDPNDYNSLITNTNSNEYRLADMTFESPNIPLQKIEQVGIRLRGAVARGSRKKSFKMTFFFLKCRNKR